MPHQWELWKSLFDYGEGELAYRIANTALTLWKNEVEETYCCFENFMSASGRGSGFHQFSGLSTPVLMFFESYYKPGTVTLGLRSIIINEEWNAEKSSLHLTYKCDSDSPIALICLAEGKKYSFTAEGKELEAKQVTEGAYEVRIPSGKALLQVKEI